MDSLIKDLGIYALPWIFLLILSKVIIKIDFVDLMLSRYKRKLGKLNRIISELKGKDIVSIELAEREIIRASRREMYGVNNYQMQDEVKKIVLFHYPSLSCTRYFAPFSRYFKWEGNKINLRLRQVIYLKIFASVMIIAGMIFGVVALIFMSTQEPMAWSMDNFYSGFYSIMAVCYMLIGIIGMPPSYTKVKKAKKYISDYYNSIETN